MRHAFEVFSDTVNYAVGSPIAFVCALTVVIIWAATGPSFNYSNTWQLVINTGTTIATFLIGFIIAYAQRRAAERDHAAMEALDRMEREHGQQLSDLHTINRQQLALLVTLVIGPFIIAAAILFRRRLTWLHPSHLSHPPRRLR